MAILGAALRAELVEALGLDVLRKDLRRELRAVTKEVTALREIVRDLSRARNQGAGGGPAAGRFQASPEQIRAARKAFGESRKAFAARLGVSAGIVSAWESGRSSPRRKAIVARLQTVLSARHGKRVINLSAQRRATLKVQGQ